MAGSFSPWAPTALQTILWHVAMVQPLGLLCGEGDPETVENVYSGIPLPTRTHTHTLPFRQQPREREYGARPPSKCCSLPSDLSCSLEFCSHQWSVQRESGGLWCTYSPTWAHSSSRVITEELHHNWLPTPRSAAPRPQVICLKSCCCSILSHKK